MSEPLSVRATTAVCVTFKRRDAIVNALCTLAYLAFKAPVDTFVVNAVFATLTSISAAIASTRNAYPFSWFCIKLPFFSVRAADLNVTIYIIPIIAVTDTFVRDADSARGRAFFC
jgi:hypothetical protein